MPELIEQDAAADSGEEQAAAQPPSPMQRFQQHLQTLHQGSTMRSWEVVEGAIHQLRQLHLELHRDVAPPGEEPSERASQHRPMTDEEWDRHVENRAEKAS